MNILKHYPQALTFDTFCLLYFSLKPIDFKEVIFMDLKIFETISHGMDKNVKNSFQEELFKVFTYQDALLRLEKMLQEFHLKLEDALKSNEFIDEEKARNLFKMSQKGLEKIKENPKEPWVPWLLAAISYFVETYDGSHDFEEIDGFRDDEDILKAVLQYFSLDI